MAREPKRSISLLVCGAMVRIASCLVPAGQRPDWRREWESEIWHRWQFLAHLDAWNKREALLLFRRSTGVFPDAFWQFAAQDSVQAHAREWIRSPWTCLGILASGLLVLAVLTFGIPATQNLFRIGTSQANRSLVFIWFHPVSGGGDEGLPADAVAAWSARSRSLLAVAPFVTGHQSLHTADGRSVQPLLVRTQPDLFRVLGVKPALGKMPVSRGVVLTHALWRSFFRGDIHQLGAKIRIGRDWYSVVAVLPREFRFLSRQPAAYLVQPFVPDGQQMVVGRVRPGVSEKSLDTELTRIAETACYYFFRSQLRYSFLSDAAWIPLRVFTVSILASGLLVLLVSRVPLRRLAELLKSKDKKAIARRVAFFCTKLALAGAVVFVAALEWSRSESAVLYGSRDPAAGPFLLWLYILGTMGVLFWAIADQRARCPVCLKLLCFPVRVGCPGCLLLNWSGTELLCPEGHGLMHVPDLAPSWDEEAERWISLDDSWKDLFAATK
jgi:MacB-like periplasmic core domain